MGFLDWIQDILFSDESKTDEINRYNRKHPQMRQRAIGSNPARFVPTAQRASRRIRTNYEPSSPRINFDAIAESSDPEYIRGLLKGGGSDPNNYGGDITGRGRGRGNFGGPGLGEIMSQLAQMQDPSRYMMGMDELEEQAQSAVNSQYNPIIQGLRTERRQTRRRGRRDKEELGQMYGALSRSIRKDIPGIKKGYRGAERRMRNEYGNLQSQIKNDYESIQQDQEEMMKRLNIEAAAPDAMEDQFGDQAYFRGRGRMEEQNLANALDIEKRGDVRYSREGAQNARLEGTNRQADMMTQLRELMRGYGSQIQSTRQAKGQAYTSTLGDLQRQMQDTAYDRSQQDFDNYLKSIGMGHNIRMDRAKFRQSQQENQETEFDPIKSLSDIREQATSRYGLRPMDALEVYNIISSSPSLNSQEGIYNDAGDVLPDFVLANKIVEEGRTQGLSKQALQALREMALEYLGVR